MAKADGGVSYDTAPAWRGRRAGPCLGDPSHALRDSASRQPAGALEAHARRPAIRIQPLLLAREPPPPLFGKGDLQDAGRAHAHVPGILLLGLSRGAARPPLKSRVASGYVAPPRRAGAREGRPPFTRSEEHTSELH